MESTSTAELTQPLNERIDLLLGVGRRQRYAKALASTGNCGRADGDHPEARVEQFLLNLQRCLRAADHHRLNRGVGIQQLYARVARRFTKARGERQYPLAAPGFTLRDFQGFSGGGGYGLGQSRRVDVGTRLLDQEFDQIARAGDESTE